jgi:ABC-type lipoprotein release transport system permease subunit
VLTKIAWRNVWRNKRRSAITLAASSFGLAVLIFVFALGDGIHAQLIDNATRTSLGHLQVLDAAYRDDPSPEHSIKDVAEVKAALAARPEISRALPRVEASGLASSAESSVGVMIVGVDPKAEKEATRVAHAVVDGKYLEDGGGPAAPILIGAKLAKRLKVRVGDKIVLMAQSTDGSLANALFRVQGVFKTGAEALDLGAVFVPLPRVQDFLGLGTRVTSFVVYMKDAAGVDATAAALRETLPKSRYEVVTWKQLDPSLVQAIQLDDASIYILLLIVFFIVALGIVNTLLMSVFERAHEFGVLLALGLEPARVVAMVSLESLALGLMSLVGGTVLGLAASYYVQAYGIDLTRWTQGISMASAFMEPVLYARVGWPSTVKSCALVLLITVLAGLYPAVKASRLSPVDSLRGS